MYMFGHLAWGMLQPGNLLLLVLLAGFVLARRRAGRWLKSGAALGLLLLATMPIPALLLRPLELRFPPLQLPEHIDGILVLGGAVDPYLSQALGATALGQNGGRLAAGVLVALLHPEAKLALIGAGGNLFEDGLSEARASLPYVLSQGIARSRVVLEEQSRSTHENAVFAKALLHPQPGESWVLVTSAWHMPRAVAAFRGAGWQVIPYPVDFLGASPSPDFDLRAGLDTGTTALREWLGLVWYRLLGWTPELLPAPTSHPFGRNPDKPDSR
jgi:uncharacterized SAM-binding protein YcdF (DUF218 family)